MKKKRAVLMLFALAGSMAAQQPAAEKKLSFEVVSIRRAPPGNVSNRTTIVNPRRLTMQNINLVWLTYYAYGAGLSTAVRVTSLVCLSIGPTANSVRMCRSGTALAKTGRPPTTIPHCPAVPAVIFRRESCLRVSRCLTLRRRSPCRNREASWAIS